VKFEINNGLIYAPISITYDDNGESIVLKAMVDTGSAGTAVDIDRFNIDVHRAGSEMINLIGIGGRQEAIKQKVSRVGFGETELVGFEIQFCDLWDKFGFEAIVGGDVLESLNAVIHYPYREITVGEFYG
jgi:hypothetical protein